MAITNTQQSISTVAAIGTTKGSRKHMVVHNPTGSATILWIGGPGVTATTGFPLAAGATQIFGEGSGLAADREWYAVSAGAAINVQVVESD